MYLVFLVCLFFILFFIVYLVYLQFLHNIVVAGQEEEESEQLKFELKQRFKFRFKLLFFGLEPRERLKEEVKEAEERLKGLQVKAHRSEGGREEGGCQGGESQILLCIFFL